MPWGGAGFAWTAVFAGAAEAQTPNRIGSFKDWSSYAYQDANYGYNGYYVQRDDYNYYFREGFQRGYQDGYNRQYQYGRRTNGTYSMLNAILGQVLGLQSLR